ncbi:hypothetical protein KBD33_04840 [Candidatus Gracilibacteria bacterium]|nr:hypothetical protein [Candidatus Gracilibacteria bacterium]
MSDIARLEALMIDFGYSMKQVQSDISDIKSNLSVLRSDVSVLKSDMILVKDRLGSLEETVYDFREEFRSESTATRSLLNQAFEHISDQIAEPDHKPIPSLVFRSRQRFV